jgi:hypothetical protein
VSGAQLAPLPDVLPPRVRAEFARLDRAGPLPPGLGAVSQGRAGSRAEGTEVCFLLRLADGHITAVRYLAYGCPYTLAVCNWLAGWLEGGAAEAGRLGSPERWARELGVPLERLGRLLIVEDALRAALQGAAGHGISSS